MGWKLPVALLVALVLGVLALLAAGRSRWDEGTRELRERLDAAQLVPAKRVFRDDPLSALPAPVARYLRAVLRDGQPLIAAVDLTHVGTIDMGQGARIDWKPFTSTQRVVTDRPGFDWDARVRVLPGVYAHVHDAYVEGEGILQASLGGLFELAAQRGTGDIARGELMRFLAESAWYPTVLLPSANLRWQAIDATRAQATLTDGGVSVVLVFSFGADGLIERVRADARGRTIGQEIVPTPWEGRFWNYVERDGMRVPSEGEVSWVLAEGPRAYWRGRVTSTRYRFHRP